MILRVIDVCDGKLFVAWENGDKDRWELKLEEGPEKADIIAAYDAGHAVLIEGLRTQ